MEHYVKYTWQRQKRKHAQCQRSKGLVNIIYTPQLNTVVLKASYLLKLPRDQHVVQHVEAVTSTQDYQSFAEYPAIH